MILSKKTLEKLRVLINEETEYRSGPELVKFFNSLGFNDVYQQGFPSRWMYTDKKLDEINGTVDLDKCIKELFNPINFIGRIEELDDFIEDFNQYLAFEKWKIVRLEAEITFVKIDKIIINKKNETLEDETKFLNYEFDDLEINSIGLDSEITNILNLRIEEIKKCLNSDTPLSVIFLCGSTLEGILLGFALKFPKKFNHSKSSPKDNQNKVKKLHNWTLSNFIDTAYELGYLKEDVKKYSPSLREFRNYIHPYEQLSKKFNPNKHTAKISWQVLKVAIVQLSNIEGV